MSRPKSISRKTFLRQSTLGIAGLGLMRHGEIWSSESPKIRQLGKTGIRVSAVGMGATRTQEPAIIQAAVDAGITFFDTGRHYANGQNEQMLGKVFKPIRDKVVIQSKLQVKKRDIEASSSGRIHQRIIRTMNQSLEDSLRALQTDYIDVMLVHRVEQLETIQHPAVLEFFAKARSAGKIRASGFSFHSKQIEILQYLNQHPVFDVIMLPYNHKGSYVHSKIGYFREWDQPAVERELKKAAQQGIGIVAMKSCSAGPYAPTAQTGPSFSAALKWILTHDFISTIAAAMGNINEVNEDVLAMK